MSAAGLIAGKSPTWYLCAMTKQCRECGERKAVAEFYRAAQNKDGLNNSCKDCKRAYSTARYAANATAIGVMTRVYRKNNAEAIRERKAAYYKANRGAIAERGLVMRRLPESIEAKRAYDRAHYKANRERELEYQRVWREANRAKHRAMRVKRQVAKLDRTVAWADQAAIEAMYEGCPPGHQVDHVIPLQGKRVSGLHVAGNMQYLLAENNAHKGNYYRTVWEILRPDLLLQGHT